MAKATLIQVDRPWVVIVEKENGEVVVGRALNGYEARRVALQAGADAGQIETYLGSKWETARALIGRAWRMLVAEDAEPDLPPAPAPAPRAAGRGKG